MTLSDLLNDLQSLPSDAPLVFATKPEFWIRALYLVFDLPDGFRHCNGPHFDFRFPEHVGSDA